MYQQQLAIQILKTLAYNNKVPYNLHDRKFYGQYLYRVSLSAFNRMVSINHGGYYDITGSVQTQAQKWCRDQEGKIRCEGNTINYYSNDIDNLEKFVNTFEDKTKVLDFAYSLDIDKNIRIRKTRLPYHKYKYQLMLRSLWQSREAKYNQNEILELVDRYPENLFVSPKIRKDLELNCSYNPSLYALDVQMLQLAQLSLGSKIIKVIQYKLLMEIEDAKQSYEYTD
jgi:hypothetical protein